MHLHFELFLATFCQYFISVQLRDRRCSASSTTLVPALRAIALSLISAPRKRLAAIGERPLPLLCMILFLYIYIIKKYVRICLNLHSLTQDNLAQYGLKPLRCDCMQWLTKTFFELSPRGIGMPTWLSCLPILVVMKARGDLSPYTVISLRLKYRCYSLALLASDYCWWRKW